MKPTIDELMLKYYGPSKMIRKAAVVSETAGSGTYWEPLYGKKAWSQLNLEPNIFAVIPKEPFMKTGFRLLTARAHSSGGGIAESTTGGAVPSPQKLTFKQVSAKPKTIAHTFDLGELAEYLGSIDDAIELLPTYRQEIGDEHIFCINKMLGAKAEDGAAGDNMESVDRIISSYAERNGNSEFASGEADIYGLDRDADSAVTAVTSAHVVENDGVDRDLTLTLIDTVLQYIWEGSTSPGGYTIEGGGKPKVVMTKTNTLMRWQQLLEAERRFMDTARIVPTFGGVRGPAPGIETGFMVSTYFGIPIIPSQHVNNRDTIGGIYFLDTDFLKVAVAKPTTYSETGRSEGYLYRGYFAIEGMYETMAELRSYRFSCHGKLVDLK
jgi:hypothetical protein